MAVLVEAWNLRVEDLAEGVLLLNLNPEGVAIQHVYWVQRSRPCPRYSGNSQDHPLLVGTLVRVDAALNFNRSGTLPAFLAAPA